MTWSWRLCTVRRCRQPWTMRNCIPSERQSLPWMFRHGNFFGWMGTPKEGCEHEFEHAGNVNKNYDPFYKWMLPQILGMTITQLVFSLGSPQFFNSSTARVTFAVVVRPRLEHAARKLMVMLHTEEFFGCDFEYSSGGAEDWQLPSVANCFSRQILYFIRRTNFEGVQVKELLFYHFSLIFLWEEHNFPRKKNVFLATF